MSTNVQAFQPEARTAGERAALWFGVLGGIGAWAAHLGLSWRLVGYACTHDSTLWLHVVTLVAALITLAALVTAWTRWRSAAGEVDSAASVSVETNQFMGLLGTIVSALFLLLILVEGVGPFVLEACGS